MLETIAGVCRAVASEPRLLVLYHVAVCGELPSGQIAERAKLARNCTSVHLGHLASLGFLVRRRSGARVAYRLAGGSGSGLAPPVGLLARAFSNPRWAVQGWREGEALHICREVAARVTPTVARAMDVVFDAATAFTNARRLQILRHAIELGSCDEATVPRLHMSLLAWHRHVDKLRRRGYIVASTDGGWVVSTRHRSRFHGELLQYVCDAQGIPSRSS